MKLWISILLAILWLPAAAQDDILPNTHTLPSGITFRYPADWETEPDDDILYLAGPDTGIIVYDITSLDSLGIHANTPHELVEMVFAPFDQTLEFDPGGIKTLKLNQHAAAIYEYVDTDEQGSFDAAVLAVMLESNVLIALDAAFFGDRQPALDAVLEIAASFMIDDLTELVMATYTPQRAPVVFAGALPHFEPAACPASVPITGDLVEGVNLNCGWLIVSEDRSHPDSPPIYLAVAIIRSTSDNPAPDPIIYLEGGPGGSALVAMDLWPDSPFRSERDIILIDQRGTGYSVPTLDCAPEADKADPERACYHRLVGEGIRLAAYTSAQNAADINDLRLALGLDKVNLYGVSYGTRLALTVMRDHPEGLRSVILDSTFPPDVNALDEQTVNGAAAMQRLFDACAADPACAAAYKDLETTFYALVDRLNAAPHVAITDTGDRTEIFGDTLVDTLFETLYTTEAIPTLPYGIYLLDQGDYLFGLDVLSGYYSLESLQTLADPDLSGGMIDEDFPESIPDGDSEGMYNSVECNEEIHFNRYETANALAANVPPQLRETQILGVEQQFATCAYWDSGQSSPLENDPVISDIPTLVLAGSFDPITPPDWGRKAAQNLAHSYFFEFPHGGHALIDAGECPISIARAFLADPNTRPDGGCIGEITVEFFVPETCAISADDTVNLRAGPGTDFDILGSLALGEPVTAHVIQEDSMGNQWFHLENGSWVRGDVVTISGGCDYLPIVGT